MSVFPVDYLQQVYEALAKKFDATPEEATTFARGFVTSPHSPALACTVLISGVTL